MLTLTTEALNGMLALIGVVIVVAALLSGLVERSNVPQVAIFLLLGAMLGPKGMGVLQIGLDSPILRVVATLSLALVLFTDALGLRLREIRQNMGLATAILGPGTLIATALIFAGGVYLLHLPWPLALILAAALASTDPVILRGLLRRSGLPAAARLALRLESGLNDVVLLPLVLIGMAFAAGNAHGPVNPVSLLIPMFVLGPLAGLGVALIAIVGLDQIRKRIGIRRDYESLFSIGICLAAYAAAETLHGSGFLAAFAAGLAVSAQDVELCDCFQEYGETTAEMLLMFTFVLLGASLIWSGIGMLTIGMAVFLLVALAARPAALFLTLLPLKMETASRRIIAWFGPRGLSTLLLALLPVFEHVPGSAELFPVASNLVILSVVVHGASIMLFRGVEETQVETPTMEAWTIEQLREAMTQERLTLVDVRSVKGWTNSEVTLLGAIRLDPEHPVEDAVRLDIPRDQVLALYCACPSEETSGRVAAELNGSEWSRAIPIIGGWDALLKAGFPTVRR